ncbi:hypothetical protein ACFX2I_027811 [Malus domestica]
MGDIFTVGCTAICWRSTEQTLVATSSNHAEILALHEATRECFWLRAVVGHIRSSCDLYPVIDVPMMIYEVMQHASNNSRRVTSKETTPITLRRSSSSHINNNSIRRLKSQKSIHKTIWPTSSPNHY